MPVLWLYLNISMIMSTKGPEAVKYAIFPVVETPLAIER